MAKAKAKPCIKKKNAKKSYLVLVAPTGIPFKSTTKATSATDGTNTWDVDKQELSSDRKKMTIKLSGKATVSKKGPKGSKKGAGLTVDPDSGTLVITLSDPPTGVDTTTDPLPVESVDDFD